MRDVKKIEEQNNNKGKYMEIKTISNKKELSDLYNFFVQVFKEDAKENNEKFYDMSNRYKEMEEQFDTDKDMIMYIEKDNHIIAGITGKNMQKDSITLSIIAVVKEERNKKLGKELILEFEKRCKEKNIKSIDLGSRFRACPLYKKLNYSYALMVQVNDSNIDGIRNNNKYNLKEISSYQSNSYGYIIYKVDDIKEEYIKCFEKIKASYTQYIFKKEL